MRNWLFQVHQYLTILGAGVFNDTQAIQFASTFLRGPAAIWWRARVEGNNNQPPFATWNAFGEALQLEFQPVNAENAARDKLHSLVQTRSVQDYVSAFRILCLQIPGMTAPVKLDMFVRGLKDTIQRDVLIQRPQTFDAAVIIAETIDAIDFRMHRKSPRLATSSSLNITHSSGPSRPYAAASAPRPYAVAAPAPGPTPMEIGAVQRGPLSPADRERLRRTNGCFYCRKPGHLLSNCPTRPARTLSVVDSNLTPLELGNDESQ